MRDPEQKSLLRLPPSWSTPGRMCGRIYARPRIWRSPLAPTFISPHRAEFKSELSRCALAGPSALSL